MPGLSGLVTSLPTPRSTRNKSPVITKISAAASAAVISKENWLDVSDAAIVLLEGDIYHLRSANFESRGLQSRAQNLRKVSTRLKLHLPGGRDGRSSHHGLELVAKYPDLLSGDGGRQIDRHRELRHRNGCEHDRVIRSRIGLEIGFLRHVGIGQLIRREKRLHAVVKVITKGCRRDLAGDGVACCASQPGQKGPGKNAVYLAVRHYALARKPRPFGSEAVKGASLVQGRGAGDIDPGRYVGRRL